MIIAGFGHFGQIVGRLLHANEIGATVLDLDPDQIDFLGKFGFKVFYGDATRIDLLDRGVTVLERETFESALHMGRQVLQELDFGAYRARQAAMKFRAHNIKTLYNLYPHYKDQQQMVSMAVQAREELQAMFAGDRQAMLRDHAPQHWRGEAPAERPRDPDPT